MERVALLGLTLVWSVGCADRDTLYHHVDTGDDAVEPVAREGNFPEPAVSVCGQLPEHVDPIAGLVSAWGATGPVPGLSGEGEPYPQDAIRLRFSDIGFDCGEDFLGDAPAEGPPGVSGWAFAISLQAELQTPGVHALGEAAGLFPETMMWVAEEGGEIGGEGGYGPVAGPGELEIFAITDTCIIGELRDYDLAYPQLDTNGGFVAQRCSAACVPQFGNPCD